MANMESAKTIPSPEELRAFEQLDVAKRELPYANDVHKSVRSSPSLTKALALAFAVHAGGGLGLAYGKDVIHKADEVRADIQHQLETRFEPIQHSPDRLRVSKKALLEQEGETFESGTFILDAEALDEDLDGRHENHELPRQRYQELAQHVRAHLAEAHAGEHPTIDQVRTAVLQSTQELDYNYQGIGGTLMSDLLRYKSGSCQQIALLVGSLAHDVGHIQNIALRTYAPREVHDAHGTHMSIGHVAPIVMRDTPHGQAAFDLVTNRLAVRSTSDTPLERLPRRFLYPHMHYTDASGNASERSANASSINTFYLPDGDNDPYDFGAPFFQHGIMRSESTPNLAQTVASSEGTPLPDAGVQAQTEQQRVSREQADAESQYVRERSYLHEHVADDWWNLTPPNERVINTYQTEHLMLFDTDAVPVPETAATVVPPTPSQETPSDVAPTDHTVAQQISSDIDRLEHARTSLSNDPSVNLHVLDARLIMQWRLAESVATREHNPLAAAHARRQREAVQARFSEPDIGAIMEQLSPSHLHAGSTTSEQSALEGIALALADHPDIQRGLRNQLQRATPEELTNSRLLLNMLRVRSMQGPALEAINRLSPDHQYELTTNLSEEVADALHGDTRFVHLAHLNARIHDRKLEIYRHIFGESEGGDEYKDYREGDIVDATTEGYQEQLTQLQALEQEVTHMAEFRQATEGATPAEIAALQHAVSEEIMFHE